MKRFLLLIAGLALAVAAQAQPDTVTKLDAGYTPKVYSDSVSNIGANTVTGPSLYIGDANYSNRPILSARRVGDATNGFNLLLDFSPDGGTTWFPDDTVVLDSVGLLINSTTQTDSLRYNAVLADSLVRGSDYVRVRITGLTGANDTTDVWYHLRVN